MPVAGLEPILGVLVVLLGCLGVVVVILAGRAALGRELTAARAQREPAELAYQRFMLVSLRRARLLAVLVMLLAAAPVLAALLLRAPSPPLADVGAGVCALGFALILPLILYDLLAWPLLRARALRELRGSDLTGREALSIAAKRALLFSLPLLIAIEGAGVAILRDQPAYGIAAVLLFMLWYSVALRVQRQVLLGVVPLNQTQWVALGPRVMEWGRLAGVPIATVEVARTARLGNAQAYLAGSRHRRLVISDSFLAASDWRQQDAIIGYLLGHVRKRTVARVGARALIWFAVPAVMLLSFLVLPSLATSEPGNNPPLAAVVGAVLLVVASIALIVFIVYSTVRRLFARRGGMRRYVLDADRYGAELTGDPLAAMVAITTLNALNAMPANVRTSVQPSAIDRMAALELLLRQPGPRAPWAYQPVPSSVPVLLGANAITVPLNQAPPPAPVPATRYPVVAVGAPPAADTALAQPTGGA